MLKFFKRLRFNNKVWLYCNLYLRISQLIFQQGSYAPWPPLKLLWLKTLFGDIYSYSAEENTIYILLQSESKDAKKVSSDAFYTEQLMDQVIKPIILYLKDETLQEDNKLAKIS